jgi:hypothetical protein
MPRSGNNLRAIARDIHDKDKKDGITVSTVYFHLQKNENMSRMNGSGEPPASMR